MRSRCGFAANGFLDVHKAFYTDQLAPTVRNRKNPVVYWSMATCTELKARTVAIMADTLAPKQAAGLELLRELKGDFETVHETLGKILGNIVANPTEAKFRRLRTTNERIKGLLAARGARQLLVGSGFEEVEEALALPEGADLSLVKAATAALSAQQEARKEEEAQAKKEAVEQARARAMTKRRAEEPAGKIMQAKASHILLKRKCTRNFLKRVLHKIPQVQHISMAML